MTTTGFNPTMVRLLRRSHNGKMSDIPQFQSHNGAIAARLFGKCSQLSNSFQSHNGAIAAICAPLETLMTDGFNPTMVRLLPTSSSLPPLRCVVVSIPQWCDCCVSEEDLFVKLDPAVSIPQWCDCCPHWYRC